MYQDKQRPETLFGHIFGWEPQVLDQAIPELPVSPRGTTDPYNGPELALEEFLARVEILGEVADKLGKKLAIVCPWISQHTFHVAQSDPTRVRGQP